VLLGDFWMTGIGQGMEAYQRAMPMYAFAGVSAAAHTHNIFMQVLVETGVVGLLTFVGVLACFFRTQFSFLRKTGDWRKRVLAAAFVAAVVGFLMQGMFDHPFHNYRVMLAFYLFLGVANAVTDMREDT
jgi:putative inorganic carbon (HCO3(-)) transporter